MKECCWWRRNFKGKQDKYPLGERVENKKPHNPLLLGYGGFLSKSQLSL